MASRSFIFGLVRVPRWDYDWGYSAAQIELLAVDTPIVVYDKHKDKKPKPKASEVKAKAEEWQTKYGDKRGEKIDLSELIGGFNVK